MASSNDLKKDAEQASIELDRVGHVGRVEITKVTAADLDEPEILKAMTDDQKADLEIRVRRKVDWRLLPMVTILYILNYIDRNNIAAAALAGIREDLGLHGNQFQTAVSIMFVGYVLMQVPSNMFLNKTGKPAIYLPSFVIAWGAISAATAAVTTYRSLLVARFFLGVVEAAYYPGCLYYLSCWYKRSELSFRLTILYSGAHISGAFSGLLSAAITSSLDNTGGWRAWRWLFLIEGLATILVACVAFAVLPDMPRTTTWLTEEERAMAAWRLQCDAGGADDWVGRDTQKPLRGLWLALSDPCTYLLLVVIFGIAAAGSITNFFPIVVRTLNFSDVHTLLLTSPPYVLTTVVMLVNSWHSDKTGERCFHIIGPFFVGIGAYIMGAFARSVALRYASMMLILPGIYGGYTAALAWVASTMPRPASKRTVGLAFINASANIAHIYVSFLYLDSMGPNFTIAFIHNALMLVLSGAAAYLLRCVLVQLNDKLDRGQHVEGAINQGDFRFPL